MIENFEVSEQVFEEIQKRRSEVKKGNFISFEAAKKQFRASSESGTCLSFKIP